MTAVPSGQVMVKVPFWLSTTVQGELAYPRNRLERSELIEGAIGEGSPFRAGCGAW